MNEKRKEKPVGKQEILVPGQGEWGTVREPEAY